uniref:Complex I-75kD n=1 Tax=Neocallimastix frontalis TaxID=4757 RepID=K9LHV2_NEOFR|nr:iron hydrogenase precursor [Neocallimastix frontalis]
MSMLSSVLNKASVNPKLTRSLATAATEKMVNISINGRKFQVKPKTTVLDAAKANGFYIPTLCYHPRLPIAGNCRLCLVDVKGSWKPLTACTTEVWEGMEIETDTPAVVETVRSSLSMMREEHPNDCMTCESNGNCEFQDLIYRYQIDAQHPVRTLLKNKFKKSNHNITEPCYSPFDDSTFSIARDMNKCVKCGRCVRACHHFQNINILGFINRAGYERVGTPMDRPMNFTKCVECGQCSQVCPVGAITERNEVIEVLRQLDSKRKILVCSTAPAIRVALAEEFNADPDFNFTGKMVAGLRKLGFDYIFDTNFSADLTIMEEGTELINRLNNGGKFPMFTSCCPGWINMVEKSYPELRENLSTCKSPQQMIGAVIKSYFAKKLGVSTEDIIHVSVMPCTAKKGEAKRPEFVQKGKDGKNYPDIDYVLTTRELLTLMKLKKVNPAELADDKFDSPLGISSSAGNLFGVTGGVMEAAVRTAQIITGVENPIPLGELKAVRGLEGIKAATVPLKTKEGKDINVRAAVVSGGANIQKFLEKIKNKEVEFDFVEMMMCPGGCINGGGQPKSADPKIVTKKMQRMYTMDEQATLRLSHENEEIKQIYKEFLIEPNGHLSHELLHTHYNDRSKAIQDMSLHEKK